MEILMTKGGGGGGGDTTEACHHVDAGLQFTVWVDGPIGML